MSFLLNNLFRLSYFIGCEEYIWRIKLLFIIFETLLILIFRSMNITELIEAHLQSLRSKMITYNREGNKLNNLSNIEQALVLFMGIATPIIVIFRQSQLYPIIFWVLWCTITPPFIAIISFLANHYRIRETADRYYKIEKSLGLLIETSKLRYVNAKSDEDKSNLYEYMLEKTHSIEENT